jgi:hypothetical protein
MITMYLIAYTKIHKNKSKNNKYKDANKKYYTHNNNLEIIAIIRTKIWGNKTNLS